MESIALDPANPRLDLEPDRVRAVLLQAEIHRSAGDPARARTAAMTFLDRFDRAESTHPSVQLALEIAAEGEKHAARKSKGGPIAALASFE
jgi:hypothetical protein